MSIPKEPRQLMINIMYLVLTALLALNVSAEVFNAFKLVDKGLVKSNRALTTANMSMVGGIRDAAKKKPSYATYADRIDPIQARSSELTKYLEAIVEKMKEDKDENGKVRGGYLEDPKNPGSYSDELKMARDYDITTRTLINSTNPQESLGNEIKDKLLNYKDEILNLINEEDKASFEKKIAVQIDDQTWRDKDKKSWAHRNFDHMPLQAVIPLFSKYINDVKSTESAALNYLADKVGKGSINLVFEDYQVVSAPSKSYVIKGEEYAADLFVSASAGNDSNTGISISVDGRNIPINGQGNAEYRTIANKNGRQSYTAKASITNPVTKEVKTFTKDFSYEVGERSVAVSASKMNVFYIGVDNPVEISAAGVPSEEISVNITGGGTIKKDSKGKYNVRVTTPTRRNEYIYVSIKAKDLEDKKPFRVKRIPDPIPKLSNSRSGAMASGVFKVQQGVSPVLENFDFDTNCKITGFRLVRSQKRLDPEFSDNIGGKFTEKTKAIIEKARASDKYFFENIRCKCPGDGPGTRQLGSMLFYIQ